MKKKLSAKVRNKIFSGITSRLDDIQEHQRLDHDTILRLQSKIERTLINSGTFQVSPTEIITKIFSGAKIYVDPRDIAITPHIILDGVWEQDVTQAWLSVVEAGDMVFDIGSNYGYFGVLAAQQSQRDCTVVHFEANPSLIPYINKTMQLNSMADCSKVENLAVAEKAGRVKLRVLKDYLASSSLLAKERIAAYTHNRENIEVEETVSVKSVTIDSYCEENNIKEINLIKMDIEGYEDKAYLGMRKTVKNSKNLTMFIEFTPDAYNEPKRFYEMLLEDFGNVYLIDKKGRLKKPKNTEYKNVINEDGDWTMPVFSKRSSLEFGL